ncbi:major facilitator superfamily MFS_1 [Kribbella flavida DSM 17836]|uniref:Major facilitator superfamily MFS_1 n=1 Tax=Kribbella flavida (strain DSM 17836 / JCM 10339 / NBRC 14399) TaxID=479435 RepID=D2PQT2_KRIFD|nr:MFS transporter [Kribbella flavida]ADB31065.1 major facilitator superfamily MFS_1 [Kribbella flavida DSM 17836]
MSSPTLAPLREPNFRYYWLARLIDRAGTTMAGVALAFAVLEVSDSPSALGTVLAAHSIPLVVFLLAGGVLADRFGRTLVIQATNVASGLSQLAIAGLVISGSAEIWQLAALAAVNGTATAARMPALAGVLPQLVPRDQLKAANLVIAVPENALMVLGPALSGVLVVVVGPGWALAVDGATYLVATLILTRVRIPRPVEGHRSRGVVADLREGWTYLRSTTWLWVVVASFFLLNAINSGAFNTLGPVLATRTDLGEAGWGLIRSAQAVGFLVCSLILIRVSFHRPLRWGMLAIALQGLPMLVLGVEPLLVAAMVASFLAGVGSQIFNLGWDLAMQEHVPDEMLSRAYSYDMLGSFAAMPLGQLLFGPLGLAFGIQPVMIVAGIAYVVAALIPLASRSVRNLPRATAVTAPPAP